MTCKSIVVFALSIFLASVVPGVVAPAHADFGQSVRTQAGTRCYVYENDTSHGGGPLVVCQRAGGGPPFPQAPMSAEYNQQMNLAIVRDTGALSWDIGNIPGSKESAANDIVLTYGQTYNVNGWSVASAVDGTRFTNNRTGHGMFVSNENVYSF